ncbi:ALUMINUM-ACTIVATED MALATE TRANSPORTER 12-RELATED [Salix purpurea]|uniref:ALUMINUM-ACTIVATED MALATE TRANSPORTER 12-RELATED n=1 Tax=Salix purpurea TaxID=77065 RepID=A0A9Q0QH54_SALPP|nr:ALUMINUM-ACTIVATED MALATE TRANSPORTER 12-RELATED [Salix purpurea]
MELAMAILAKENWKKNIHVISQKLKRFPGLLWQTIWKVGRDDPRRVVHALKVGLSLTLVSLLYLLEPLFEGIGQNAIWAVMTVVVVLEFTAGTAATYMRFFPYVKRNYDYGVLIFLLTFNLITVSSYRVSNVMKIANERLYTIVIGCGVCLLMTLFIFPIWSGEDLHNSTVAKLEGLAKSIQSCVDEYFSDVEKEKSSEDPIDKGYKAVLDSKSQDETLALHASWEPRHSRHCRYPWEQYVKLGAVLRHFGYTVVALHGCLQTEIQTPRSYRALFKDPCSRVADEVSKALIELANSIKNRRRCSPGILSDYLHEALQDLDDALKSQPRLFLGSNNNQTTSMLALAAARANAIQKHAKNNVGVSLSSSFKTDTSALIKWKSRGINNERSKSSEASEGKALRPQLGRTAITSLEFSEALPFAAFASLLVETVARLDNVIEEVEELGRIARFKEFKSGDEVAVMTAKPL